MSKLKKMRLVPLNSEELSDNDFISRKIISNSPPNLTKFIQLSHDMRKILESNMDDEFKVKLFTQNLSKFLKMKDKVDAEKDKKVSNDSDVNISEKSIIPSERTKPSSPTEIINKSSLQVSPTNFEKTLKTLRRSAKKTAADRINKFFTEKTSSEDSDFEWRPYNAPKKIKRINRGRKN